MKQKIDSVHEGMMAVKVGTSSSGPTPDDPRVTLAMKDYIAALEGGHKPNRHEFLIRHAEIAEVLGDYLDGLEFIHTAAPQLQPPADGELADVATPRIEVSQGAPLGDYRLIREVGRGGMGVVYEAEQISLGRRVALKVLPFASTLDTKQLQRFKNEAQAAAHLHHQNIVPVYAIGCERGVHYYAMQFIDGQTLAALIRELRPCEGLEPEENKQPDQPLSQTANAVLSGSFSPTPPSSAASKGEAPRGGDPHATGPYASVDQAPGTTQHAAAVALSTERSTKSPAFFGTVAKLGIQAAEALEYAHHQGIIHRDIKPANLLVDVGGNLWITDFGLANCQSQAGLTMSGDLVGTLRYMSPEQALAKRVVVDHRTDIYSLGVTLYELLTLAPAFAGRDRQELLRQIAFEDPKAPRLLNKAIPAELETIVLKAMEKNPSDRYATTQEVAEDLERYVKDEPIRARRPTLVQRIRKWARRNQPVVWSVAACLLIGGAVMAASIGWMARDQAARWAKTAGAAGTALDQGATLLQQPGKLAEARAAIERAEAVLGNATGNNELQDRLEALMSELIMATKLDDLRLELTHARANYFKYATTCQAYQEAFGNYGLDVEAGDPEEVARRIQTSAICDRLVTALDGWLMMKTAGLPTNQIVYGGVPLTRPSAREQVDELAGWQQLLSIARRVDPDPWRNRLRQAFLETDPKVLAALARDPEVAKLPAVTLTVLGRILARKALFPEAVGVLRQGQSRHPDDFWIHHDLGEWLMRLTPHQTPEAIGCFRAALALRPDCPDIYEHLGTALREQGKLPEALEAFQHSVYLKPDQPWGHCDVGCLLVDLGRLDEALAEIDEALRLKPDFPCAFVNRAYALQEKGETGQALAAIHEALRLNPEFAAAHNSLAWLLATCPDPKSRDGHRAVEAAKQAVALRPDVATYRNTLGVAHYRAGEWKAAVKALHQSMDLAQGGDAFDWFFLALAHWQLDEKDQARQWYDRAAQWMEKNQPKDKVLRRFRAEAEELVKVEKKAAPK